jgi:ketosteroid isomerase-like protein
LAHGNVEAVRQALDAVNRRDISGYLACCTEDIELKTPLADFAGSYRGADGIRRFFADIEDAGPDFRLQLERIEPVDADRVIAFLQVHVSGRASGVPLGIPTANVYELSGGRIRRIEVFSDRRAALRSVGLTELA